MTILEELTTGPLAAEIAPLITSGDAQAILAVLQRKDIPSPGQISAHDIKQYFSLIGVRRKIIENTSDSCKDVTLALEDFPLFDLTIPEVYVKFIATLEGLVADTLVPDFTEEHKNTVLYLASKLVSREQQSGITFSLQAIQEEIWNDDGTRRLN